MSTTFTIIPPPTEKPSLPEWVAGARIDWHEGYSNSPTIQLECHDWPRWGQQIFTHVGDFYIAEHVDGLVITYKHDGKISIQNIPVWVSNNGDENLLPPRDNPRSGSWQERPRLCTSQQRGFGGSHIPITLDDGRELVLRGPWSAGNPTGYQESALYKVGEQTGIAQAMSHSLLTRSMQVYMPEIELAEVRYGHGGVYVEPIHPDWGHLPKMVLAEVVERGRRAVLGKPKPGEPIDLMQRRDQKFAWGAAIYNKGRTVT